MAGLGKRMRPHTLTTAKPLLPIAGRPIVERLMEDIVRVCDQPVHRIAFITSPLLIFERGFPPETERNWEDCEDPMATPITAPLDETKDVAAAGTV